MSIREIVKNKKYKIELFIGRNGNKKIMHYEVVEGGKKEAELRESELKIQIKNNTYIKKNNMTINDLIYEWSEYIKSKVAITTYNTYCLYTQNISKTMGHIKIRDLNVKILEDFYQQLKKYKRENGRKLAEKTIKHYYETISNVLNCAVKWGYIQNNPNELIEQIKVPKKEMPYYNPQEVEKLLLALEHEPIKYQALIVLALDSGARRGEITGLKWSDIDFKEGTIDINKTTQHIRHIGTIEKETKNFTSNRKIAISKTTLELLKKHQKIQLEEKMKLGSKWGGSERVFTTPMGEDLNPDRASKVFRNIQDKHHLKRINFHGLRHTSISLQIRSGIQPLLISRRAGHSNISVTYSVYSHFFQEEFKEVADKMDSFLNIKIS